MRIRIIDDADIRKLLELYRHLDPDDKETTTEDARKNWESLKRYPGSEIIVGCLDNELVTTCTLVVIPNLTRGGASYALIENVVTHTAYRKRGYGKAVLQEAVEAAWRAGCYKVMLLTGSKRCAVHKFYQEAGFEQNKTGFQIRRIPPRSSLT
ncbi:GNAT family N-acetyltransferase [Oryzifoliimicrobium ureilyticus]|uniref:GNAT family N-acetyltransferase n=1 Tax=Oryzifoliimicrobium ureilyticus TaxID=3113724 RepID=UPI0030764A10